MDLALRKKLLRACDLNEPVPLGDDRYYDFDQSGLRGRPWRENIRETLLLADRGGKPTRQVVAGLPGSGKSTELLQLCKELASHGFDPVLADAGRWVGERNPIEARDLLLALALALYPEGRPNELSAKANEYVQRFWNLLGAKSREIEADATVQNVGLRATFSVRDTLFQELAARIEGTEQFVEDVHQLLKEERERRWKEKGTDLVILLDGIEKRATGDLYEGEEQGKFRNHWVQAFLVNAQELSPPIHVVYTVPPFMLRSASQVASQFGEELRFLPMVRLYDYQEGQAFRLNPAAVRAMREALFLRIPQQYWESPEVASYLVAFSGGYLRDLLRMAIDCVRECRDASQISRTLAQNAVAQVRQSYLYGLELEQKTLLKEVHQLRAFTRDENNGPRYDRLLQSHMLLHYQNGSPLSWYDAHPLLWGNLGFPEPGWPEVLAAST